MYFNYYNINYLRFFLNNPVKRKMVTFYISDHFAAGEKMYILYKKYQVF